MRYGAHGTELPNSRQVCAPEFCTAHRPGCGLRCLGQYRPALAAMNGMRGLRWATISRRTQRAVLACALLLWSGNLRGLDPSLDVSQYAHTAWKVSEGFNTGTIRAIAQTPDGYLWLGAEFGLFRFDGVRAVPWQPPAGEQLPSSLIRRLLTSRDGTLWIGTDKGLASWKDGRLARYPDIPAQRVDALLEDKEGAIWVGVETIPTWRLCAIRNVRVECSGEEGSLGLGVGTLLEDRSGNVWTGTGTGMWKWKPGVPNRIPLSGPTAEIHALVEDNNGALLVATRGGIKRLVDGKIEAYPLPGAGPEFNPFWLLRDRHGGLWIGTIDQGILHVHQGRIDRFTQPDGLSSDSTEALFEDREGNVWVCTNNGLDRFRDFAVTPIPIKQGLTNAYVESVLTSRDGSVWLGTRSGLYRWNDGRLTLYRKQPTREPGTAPQIIESRLPDDFQSSLYQDHRGRIWVFSRNGAAYFEHDRFVPVRAMPGGFAHSITEDRAGDLWICQDQALFHLLRGGAVEQIPWASLRPQGLALVVFADPLQGGLWLGFSEGGVAYFKDGKVRASYGTADGLGEGRVNAVHSDQDGTLWVATEGGLSRVKNGVVTTLTNLNGLPCRSTHEIAEDETHALWLYMACGLVRIARPEVEAWAANSRQTIQATIFDNSDGLRSAAVAGGLSPRVDKSSDGRMWYVSEGGVFVIDPRRLDRREFSFNKLPPAVHIERVIADGMTYWQSLAGDVLSSHPKLPPLVHNLTIDYAALSMVAPEKEHFRYKLEGQDEDWREVINGREVQYSNLSPGHYRFRVLASNNSGVWNDEGESLDFVIPPAWYQTNWFRAASVVVLLALFWLAYRMRIREVEEREKKFREAVESMPALAFVASSEYERTFVNKGWVEYTGLTVEQASGSGWQDAVHPDDLKRVVDKWRTAMTTGEPLDYEVRLRHAPDGEYRWFQTRVVPLQDKRGKTVKWCGVANDIEDRKRAEQLQADLAHTNRVSLLGELAVSISHELKQPIMGTITNARATKRWLDRDQPNLDEVRQAVDRIERDGTRATAIIDRLRSLYKKSPPKRELVDVNEMIGDMVMMLRSEATRNAVSIRSEFTSGLPKISADRVQVQQVLMNLMLNGIEAMKDTGGVLTIKSQPEDGHVHISVTDTGIGLPAESVERIFDAFFTTKPQGSGMGLAISRSIIESHGGRLWATPNDGRGASFHFTLPTAADPL